VAPCRVLVPVGSFIVPVPFLPSLYYFSCVQCTSTLKMEAAHFFKTLVPTY
jgi:hypothetical protein